MKYEVKVMWRKSRERRYRAIHADSIEQARHIAFIKFGPNRGVRLAESESHQPPVDDVISRAEALGIAQNAALLAAQREKANIRPGDPRYQHKATTALEIKRQLAALPAKWGK